MRSLLACGVLLVCGLIACGKDASLAAPDAPGGSGIACGGLAGVKCAASEFCDYSGNTCGAADEGGVCRARPANCPGFSANLIEPVGRAFCGCDGGVYATLCSLNLSGTDLNANGCLPVKGRFSCGFVQCDLATEYCLHNPNATADEAFTCVALPTPCKPATAATCDCLDDTKCPAGSACTGDGGNGLRLTCN
ncbi:MAG TPA: hypothetical protein VFP84_26735 [Kofleriaceae bacterium]|nr:hypothetical protein [Kofleriaceae bacterium]